MNRLLPLIPISISLLTLAGGAPAQDLSLFEAVQSNEPQNQTVRRRATPDSGRPEYTLRSTSRFGDEYIVVLNDNDNGEPVSVNWRANSTTEIGSSGYRVLFVGSREASIRMPGEQACSRFPEEGVDCSSDGTIALLSLLNAEPVERPEPERSRPDSSGEAGEQSAPDGERVNEEGQRVVINPFSGEPQVVPEVSEEEMRARRERQAARAERLSNFEVPRIAPEDVPDGMRVVSTPFGDRLVPDNE